MTHPQHKRVLPRPLTGILSALIAAPSVAEPSAEAVIDALQLEGHVEGGFFRRTYEAGSSPRVATPGGERYLMTSIFYLLTAESPIGHFHRNRSDIVHYFQLGDAIDYFLIHPDGRLEEVVLGRDVVAGERLQLTVPGGVWKASRVRAGTAGYGLISEAVAPGFDYADMELAERGVLQDRFPQHAALIEKLTRDAGPVAVD